MSNRQPVNIPIALSRARHQLDHWRSRQRSKRARLPKELWRQAVALAREHGLNKTARALGLKYCSLKKHLNEADTDELVPAKTKPDFIELVGGVMTPGSAECTIEWADGSGPTVAVRRCGCISEAPACRIWLLWRACSGAAGHDPGYASDADSGGG